MPNFAILLKDEIRRLSKKEAKGLTAAMKRDTVRLKRDNSGLRKRLEALEREVARLRGGRGQASSQAVKATDSGDEGQAGRLTSRTVAALRKKLGLSQNDLAVLLDVHKNSVHSWENGKSSPRGRAKKAILGLRGIGAREAKKRLEGLGIKPGSRRQRRGAE